MIKFFKWGCSALLGSFLSLGLFFSQVEAQNEPLTPQIFGLNVVSAILYDLDNDILLYAQNEDQLIQPASLTKIMTMYLALEQIQKKQVSFRTLVPISEKAANEEGSRMGLKAGEEVPLGNLLLGMAISSGNDASLAVAEFLGGNAQDFIKSMNEKAFKLGLRHTHFCTPNGLPKPDQYTTAKDMLLLARAYLKRFPWALQIFHNQRVLKHNNYVSWNKNPLLEQYPGCDGLKSGWVRASGYNLIFTALRGNKRLLAVILGAPNALNRGVEACRLLDAGFLVCARREPSVEAALLNLPGSSYKLDLSRSAHEARDIYGYVSRGRKARGRVNPRLKARKKEVSRAKKPKERRKAKRR